MKKFSKDMCNPFNGLYTRFEIEVDGERVRITQAVLHADPLPTQTSPYGAPPVQTYSPSGAQGSKETTKALLLQLARLYLRAAQDEKVGDYFNKWGK